MSIVANVFVFFSFFSFFFFLSLFLSFFLCFVFLILYCILRHHGGTAQVSAGMALITRANTVRKAHNVPDRCQKGVQSPQGHKHNRKNKLSQRKHTKHWRDLGWLFRFH